MWPSGAATSECTEHAESEWNCAQQRSCCASQQFGQPHGGQAAESAPERRRQARSQQAEQQQVRDSQVESHRFLLFRSDCQCLKLSLHSVSSSSSTTNGTTTVDTFDGFVIALHRKMVRSDSFFCVCTTNTCLWSTLNLYKCKDNLLDLQIRMDVYFLSSQKSRPSLFGTPLILPCDEPTTKQDLYGHVWTQVSRLVSPLPPSESNTPNHAQDW